MIVRLLQTIIVLSLLAIVLILANTAAISVHEAVFTDSLPHDVSKAITFDQPDVDRLFYANLANPASVDFYKFQATKGLSFKSKILIPRLPTQANFRPALVLFGPSLPTATNSEIYQIPFNLPTETGLVTSIADNSNINNKTQTDQNNDSIYSRFDEPYTQSGYWEGQILNIELPQTGTYYLAVFSPNYQTGKYALEVGNRDATGLKETLAFPILWLNLKLWFDNWLSPAMLLLGIVLLLAGFTIGRTASLRQLKLAPNMTIPKSILDNKTPIITTDQAATPTINSASPSQEGEETLAQAKIGEDYTYNRYLVGKVTAKFEADFLDENELSQNESH
jgi:hypothetical protein